jgi:DNA-directed RNA polymerase subunit RPC12/RpoP
MKAQTNRREPPDSAVEILDELDTSGLRAVHAYIAERLADRRATLSELIRSDAGDEPVEIIDNGAYTLVRRYPSTPGSTEAGSQPLSLYRVKREKRVNGEVTLHWSYLGDVTESTGVECENCGVPLAETASVCSRCSEETSQDEEE